MAENELGELLETVRQDERRKAEIQQLLQELREAHSGDDAKHREIVGRLNYLERLLTASYNLQRATYTMLCGGQKDVIADGDALRRELEQRGLERDLKELRERVTIRAEAKGDLDLHVDGDVVGGGKDDKQAN